MSGGGNIQQAGTQAQQANQMPWQQAVAAAGQMPLWQQGLMAATTGSPQYGQGAPMLNQGIKQMLAAGQQPQGPGGAQMQRRPMMQGQVAPVGAGAPGAVPGSAPQQPMAAAPSMAPWMQGMQGGQMGTQQMTPQMMQQLAAMMQARGGGMGGGM